MDKKRQLFETDSVPHALAVMALPTIVSQLITLVYNLADTWFVGRTNNPYMVAACSLVLPVFMFTISAAYITSLTSPSGYIWSLDDIEKILASFL